jgi:hypothetical protein
VDLPKSIFKAMPDFSAIGAAAPQLQKAKNEDLEFFLEERLMLRCPAACRSQVWEEEIGSPELLTSVGSQTRGMRWVPILQQGGHVKCLAADLGASYVGCC